jgi:hypothetical protein
MPLPCLPWPCRSVCIPNLVDSSPPLNDAFWSQLPFHMPCQHCKLRQSRSWLVSISNLSIDARSIHRIDYAISDKSCCPRPQTRTQNRLRVSGLREAPMSNPAGLEVVHVCLSECWSSRQSSPSLVLELLNNLCSACACLSIIFSGACAPRPSHAHLVFLQFRRRLAASQDTRGLTATAPSPVRNLDR